MMKEGKNCLYKQMQNMNESTSRVCCTRIFTFIIASAWAKQANVYASDSGLLCNHDSIQYVVCNLIRGND